MPIESLNLHDKKDKTKATPEEMKMISEKMKDPEFMKLFAEYAESLQDPAYRKEEEEYLEQVEREAREGGDNSFEFIFPKPHFCVELLQKDKQCKTKKAFLNICSSEKIDVYEERTTNDRMGSHWHIPVSVGPSREEDAGKHSDGKLVETFDAVFHPKTVAISDGSEKFMVFLLEIAVENLNAGYNREFGFGYKRLSSATPSIGQPKNQTIKKKNDGSSMFPKDTEKGVSFGPIRATPASANQKSGSSASNANQSDNKIVPPSATPPPPKKNEVPAVTPAGPKKNESNVPKHKIAHRGEVDLTDAWNWKKSDKRIGVPKELVVKLEFVGVKTAKVLDINVEPTYISIEKTDDHAFWGEIPMPFTVLTTPASAKFEKNKGTLTLVLTVVPPPKPAESQMEKEAAAMEQVIELEDKEEASPKKEDASPSEASPSEASPSASPERKQHQDPVVVAPSAPASPPAAAPTKAAVASPPEAEKKKDSNAIFSNEDALNELDELDNEIRASSSSHRGGSSERPAPVVHRVSATGPKKTVDAPPAPAPSKEPEAASPPKVAATTNTTSSPKQASPPKFDHVADGDRASQLRAALEKARLAREEAEKKEEEATGRPSSGKPSPVTTPQKKKKSDSETTATVAEPVTSEKATPTAAAAAAAAAAEAAPKEQDQGPVPVASNDNKKDDLPEMVDLRKKQDEWLEGVKQTEREEELRKQMEEEEAEMKRMVEKVQREQEQEREAKRKAKEQIKKLQAEKETERLAAILAEKRKELPLHSHHIFALN